MTMHAFWKEVTRRDSLEILRDAMKGIKQSDIIASLEGVLVYCRWPG